MDRASRCTTVREPRTKDQEPLTSQPAYVVARAELTLGLVTRITAHEPSHLHLAMRR